MNAQADLFSGPLVPLAPAQKLFRGANGVGLPYWEQDGKITQVALSDKLILPVTHQKGGHIYANDPGEWGRIERKNKISFLSAAAQIRRAIEINNSMQDSLKEQEKWLHGALEIRPVPPTVQRQHARKKDVAQESSNLIYANPFQDHSKNFGKGPDWLLQRRDLRPIEKLIYARLLFPMKICEQWD